MDPNLPPRKVSMSYILGLSNKPFKDPPPPPRPPQPSALMQMLTTPGGIVEWTASDGRKGKFTGSGRQRLTAASLAKVESAKKAKVSKTTSKKAATERVDSSVGGMCGLFDEPDKDAKSEKKKQGKEDDSGGWSPQQDEMLMKLKTENANLSWGAIAVEVGKSADQCKGRFKNIKPKDWKPDAAKKGGKGGGGVEAGGDGNGKGGKNKGNNQNEIGQKGGKKNDGKQNEANCNEPGNINTGNNTGWNAGNNSGGNDVTWANDGNTGGGANAWDNVQNTGGKADANGDTSGWNNNTFGDNIGAATEKKDDTADVAWGNNSAWGVDGAKDQTGADSGDVWGRQNKSGSAAATNSGPAGWDTSGATGNDAFENTWGAAPAADGGTPAQDNNAWPSVTPAKPASRAHSKTPTGKAASQHQRNQQSQPQQTPRNNTTQNVIVAPLELEVKPDNTFSADDLRLVARILQQDCGMVWNRVSWRFRDKTGRTLHPDTFERKITGHVEGKGSDKGERRRK